MHSWDSKKVKIRRNRHCLGCGDRHQKGDTMYAHTGVGEDGFWSYHMCEICEAFIKSPKFHWDDYTDGGFIMSDPMFEREDRIYWDFRYAYENNLILA